MGNDRARIVVHVLVAPELDKLVLLPVEVDHPPIATPAVPRHGDIEEDVPEVALLWEVKRSTRCPPQGRT